MILYRRGKPAFGEPVHWDWLIELITAGALVSIKPERKWLCRAGWCLGTTSGTCDAVESNRGVSWGSGAHRACGFVFVMEDDESDGE